MTQIAEIQAAIEALPENDYAQLRQWFYERDWQEWDEQIQADSESGRLDFLIQDAREAKAKGQLKDL